MNLRRHIVVIRSSAYLIAGALIVAISISFAVSSILPRTYESRATLYVGQSLGKPQLDYSGLLASQIVTQTYSRLATTRPVLAAVIHKLGLSTSPEALQNNVSGEVSPQGTLLAIVVRQQDAETAAAIANTIAQQLLAMAPKEDPAAVADRQRRLADLDSTLARLQVEVDALRALRTRTVTQNDRLDSLEERLVTFSQARASLAAESTQGSPNALSLVDPAVASPSAVAPSRVVIVGSAAAAALALSILLAYLIDALRRGPDEGKAAEKANGTRTEAAAGDPLPPTI